MTVVNCAAQSRSKRHRVRHSCDPMPLTCPGEKLVDNPLTIANAGRARKAYVSDKTNVSDRCSKKVPHQPSVPR